ncbi:MAG: acetyl-CoA carboxylase biotin carboxylase subunit [Polyangiales bacterium]
MSRFSTVLVANRGEIACRVIRSAKSLGYKTVAVYSDADADALHVRLADVATRIGPAPVKDSYLSIENLLAAAKRTGADAIHPGYGFLSENENFAKACEDAGIVFIGPPAEAIRLMGNKATSKRLMIDAKVPTIPGWQGTEQDEDTLSKAAEQVGYPLLIKAAAGGGGRGMRLVHAKEQFLDAYRTAKAEAENAFGSGEVLLERALLEARHVEIQVFGDKHGNVVHLGERDCSIQRRHQKIVEESPSPAVDEELRARMGAAGVAAAKSIGYVGAGTVEFLLDKDGSFYFLEMNTRLQVEHPVTEMVTGLDLVALQLRVAAGEKLPFAQEDVRLRGHAIEIRLYAEDPYGGFLPQTGRVYRWAPAIEGSEEGVVTHGMRVDHGLVKGQEVTPWYDPMLAKLIAHGKDREESRRRIVRLLEDSTLLGVTTNKTFLGECLNHEAFVRGEATTKFIDRYLVPEGKDAPVKPAAPKWASALAALLLGLPEGDEPVFASTGESVIKIRLGHAGEKLDATAKWKGGHTFVVELGGEKTVVAILRRDGNVARILVDDVQRTVRYCIAGTELFLDLGSATEHYAELPQYEVKKDGAGGDGRILAPMNGRIVSVNVEPGMGVVRGQVVVVLEAMKMQHQILADVDGVVDEVLVSPNAQVSTKALLVHIEPLKEG